MTKCEEMSGDCSVPLSSSFLKWYQHVMTREPDRNPKRIRLRTLGSIQTKLDPKNQNQMRRERERLRTLLCYVTLLLLLVVVEVVVVVLAMVVVLVVVVLVVVVMKRSFKKQATLIVNSNTLLLPGSKNGPI